MEQSLTSLRSWCEGYRIPLISSATESLLHSILHQYRPDICVEIGSATGYSTAYISTIVQDWEAKVYSLEIAYNSYVHACYHTQSFPHTIIYPFDAQRIDLAALVGTQVDFAFIDGQKSQYGQYLAKLQPLLQPGAIVVLDDVIKFRNKLDGLYSYLSQKQIIYRVEHIEDDDGVMICEF